VIFIEWYKHKSRTMRYHLFETVIHSNLSYWSSLRNIRDRISLGRESIADWKNICFGKKNKDSKKKKGKKERGLKFWTWEKKVCINFYISFWLIPIRVLIQSPSILILLCFQTVYSWTTTIILSSFSFSLHESLVFEYLNFGNFVPLKTMWMYNASWIFLHSPTR
jgi:hypothetical protein